MTHLSRRAFLVMLTLSIAIFLLGSTGSGSDPSAIAQNTFEAMRSAEASGANIDSLVSQYNSLLQQSAPDSSFVSVQSQAAAVQQAALASKTFNGIFTIVLIPVIPLFLAVLTVAIFRLLAKVARKKILDMEIRLI